MGGMEWGHGSGWVEWDHVSGKKPVVAVATNLMKCPNSLYTYNISDHPYHHHTLLGNLQDVSFLSPTIKTMSITHQCPYINFKLAMSSLLSFTLFKSLS